MPGNYNVTVLVVQQIKRSGMHWLTCTLTPTLLCFPWKKFFSNTFLVCYRHGDPYGYSDQYIPVAMEVEKLNQFMKWDMYIENCKNLVCTQTTCDQATESGTNYI